MLLPTCPQAYAMRQRERDEEEGVRVLGVQTMEAWGQFPFLRVGLRLLCNEASPPLQRNVYFKFKLFGKLIKFLFTQ